MSAPQTTPDDAAEQSPADAAEIDSRPVLARVTPSFGPETIELAAASGTRLVTAGGEELVDMHITSQLLGHGHGPLRDAVASAASTTDSTVVGRHTAAVSERLLATLDDPIDALLLVSSGSEAVDLAVRVARVTTGAKGVIVTANAWHGTTAEVAALSPALGDASTLAGWLREIDAPRGDGAGFLADLRDAVADLSASEYGVAAIILDPAFVLDGLAPAADLEELAAIAHDSGAVLIADEQTSGPGRAGARWSHSAAGISPDVVTFGSSLAGGLPFGAVALTRATADAFAARGRDGNTVLRRMIELDPFVAAAVTFVLDTVDESTITAADSVGEYLRSALELLATASSALGEVRGRGLLTAVTIVDDDGAPSGARAARVLAALRARGVLAALAGPGQDSILFRPAITAGSADVDTVIERLYGALTHTEDAVVVPGATLIESVPRT